ncbi:MAG: SusC/RagA family TonB-linked outer membrane protein [Salinivirgaceae bacterium]
MKANYLKFVLPVILWLFTFGVYAQSYTVTGVVKDANDGLGLPGVNVIEKGTQNGTITDFDGNYKITLLNADGVLQFSFIGYKTMEMPVNGQALINVDMTSELTELDELVVIGYGVQKKKVATGAIASVKAEEITSRPILRVEEAMQGRTPGVQVTSLSGQPGEAPTVRVRGAGTTGNAEPLYIVDGMRVGGIDALNPSDIESMEILKDAGSAAIYGASAANGVVLITTKSGKAGKMKVTYSAYYGIQNPIKKLDMLNADQYREYWNEAKTNSGITKPEEFFDMNEITHNTNWQDHIFESNAGMTDHNIAISGGNEKSNYASSLSYFDQNGIIGGDKSYFKRLSARFNSNHQVKDWLRFGNNFTYSHIEKKNIGSNESFNGVYSGALNLDPLTPLYETDENILSQTPYSNQPVVKNSDGQVYGISNLVGSEVVNPMALLEIQTAKTRVDKIVGSVFAEAEIIKGLVVKTNAGIDLAYVLDDSYRPLYYLNSAQSNTEKTSVSKSITRYYTWQWDNTISYSKQINEHSFTGLVGISAIESAQEDLSGFNAKVPVNDPDNIYLNMATDTVWTAYGGASAGSMFSSFGRITYDFKSRYAFTGIIRRDGSSNFGANERYGIFPSLGVSWFLSEEPFMPTLGPVNYLKLRASWGINGNENIGRYQYVASMDKTRGYIFGGGRLTGASPSFIENADIKWEESEQLDIAFDAGVFENKLTVTFDYYIKNTKDLLERVPIPGHVGNDAPFANVGSVQNKGIEIALNWRHRVNDLNYSFGVNGSYNINKMTKINSQLAGASWSVFPDITKTTEGDPIAYFYGFKTDGIFQNQTEVYQHIGSTGAVLQPKAVAGDVRFVDVNNDGILNDDDRTKIGNPTPDFTLGINGSVEYKNFDFSFLLTGAYGHEIFNGTQRIDLRYTNRTTAVLDRWTGEGTSNEVPRAAWTDVNRNYRISDMYVEDGSYLKVKNVQLGYNIPQNLLNIVGIESWRVYVSGENLYTFTDYSGVDPEIGARSALDLGIDRGVYPQSRTIRFGTVLTF